MCICTQKNEQNIRETIMKVEIGDSFLFTHPRYLFDIFIANEIDPFMSWSELTSLKRQTSLKTLVLCVFFKLNYLMPKSVNV